VFFMSPYLLHADDIEVLIDFVPSVLWFAWGPVAHSFPVRGARSLGAAA
jgi:hypothetical protein